MRIVLSLIVLLALARIAVGLPRDPRAHLSIPVSWFQQATDFAKR